MSFSAFISSLLAGGVGFADIGELVSELYARFLALPGAAPMHSLLDALGGAESAAVFASLFLLSLFVCIFGKRMMSYLRFLAFLLVGYFVGVCFLAPAVASVIPYIPQAVIGGAVAVVFAVLSRPLYFLAYPVAVGAAVYVLVANTLAFGVGAAVPISVIAIILGLILRKYVEMLATAMLGAFGMCASVRLAWDFAASSDTVILVLTLILGMVGTLVQFKTRSRK